jgi:hypothetical protein
VKAIKAQVCFKERSASMTTPKSQQDQARRAFGNYRFSLTQEEQGCWQKWLRFLTLELPEQADDPTWRMLHDLSYTTDWTETPGETEYKDYAQQQMLGDSTAVWAEVLKKRAAEHGYLRHIAAPALDALDRLIERLVDRGDLAALEELAISLRAQADKLQQVKGTLETRKTA